MNDADRVLIGNKVEKKIELRNRLLATLLPNIHINKLRLIQKLEIEIKTLQDIAKELK